MVSCSEHTEATAAPHCIMWLVVSGPPPAVIKACCVGKEPPIGASHLPLLYPLGLAPTLREMASLLKARDALHSDPFPRLQASPVSTCCGGSQYIPADAWSWEMHFSPCQEAGQKQFTNGQPEATCS